MKLARWLRLGLVMVMVPLYSGCWYAAAAGAGAYGGYKAKEEGYTLQSPVTKEDKKKAPKKESQVKPKTKQESAQ